MKKKERCSGILMHISSLPGKYGIGTFGKEAYDFVDFLYESGQKIWQILPLGHTGFGDSPYQCYSAFAGNPLFIDTDKLIECNLLNKEDIPKLISFKDTEFDTQKTSSFVIPLLKKASVNFQNNADNKEKEKYNDFCKKNEFWLDDYALFISLKDYFEQKAWYEWDILLKMRNNKELKTYIKNLSDSILFHKTVQYFFFDQWMALKQYANKRGIRILGDIPLYVAYDSSDAWSSPEIFHFDKNKTPIAVAGVPPDYFSGTGQLWGNPLYNWEYLKKSGFSWWIERIKANFVLFDILRIDHFRGLAGFWAVPYGEKTAERGQWIDAPGIDLFDSILRVLGDIPIIAEDLGVITDDVEFLRNKYNFPGMKILQFAFDSQEESEFLPHTFTQNCVVYTGTHDNDTTVGWYESASEKDKAYMHEYFYFKPEDVHWGLIRLAWQSVAYMSIAPMQDLLGLGAEHRMNLPGKPTGYWKWRVKKEAFNKEIIEKLRHLNRIYYR